MASTMFKAAAGAAFKPASQGSRARRHAVKATCSAPSNESSRRGVLLGLAGAAAAVPLLAAAPPPASAAEKVIKAENLSFLQRKAIVSELQSRAERELRKVVSAEDAADAVRLVLHDAGTGAVNGSVVLPEELSRPENKGLKPLVDRLAVAKKAVDAVNTGRGQAAISWADTIVLAAKVATEAKWRAEKIARAKDPAKGAQQSDQFGTPVVVAIGRSDAAAPGPAGRIPAAGASPDDVRAFMTGLGGPPKPGKKPVFNDRRSFLLYTAAQPGAEEALAADPEYASWQKKYDRSRRTVTRTDYEVDFVDYLNLLAEVGTTLDSSCYLADQVLDIPTKL